MFHALEIGKTESPVIKRALFAFTSTIEEGYTQASYIIQNTTLSLLDDAKRGIFFCQNGIELVGETLHEIKGKIKERGNEIYNGISNEIKDYKKRKRDLIRYSFRNPKEAARSGAVILTIAGTTVVAAIALPETLVVIGSLLAGSESYLKGILFVINGKDVPEEEEDKDKNEKDND